MLSLVKITSGIFLAANILLFMLNSYWLLDNQFSNQDRVQTREIMDKEKMVCSDGDIELVTAWAWDDYIVNIYWIDDISSGFEILKKNKLAYREEKPGSYYIGGLDGGPLITPGQDITGDGQANLVVEHYGGGAHNPLTYLFFTLGETLEKHNDVNKLNGAKFIDVNNDGIIKMCGYDDAFAYFGPCCYAESPRPKVIISFDCQTRLFLPDAAFMRVQKPELSELEHMASIYSTDEQWLQKSWPPTSLIETMLSMMYGGCEEAGWQLLDMSWPPDVQGKEAFREIFLERLEKRSIYHQIKLCQKDIVTG